MAALRAVETPDGDPVFETVAPRERYFHGKNAENAPDVVTVPDGMGQFLSAQLLGDRFAPPTEPWNHKLDGVFAAYGDGVDPDAMTDHPHIFDVAPTVMAALGIPYSDRMDGEVVPVVEDVGAQSYPEYDGDGGATMDEDAVEQRLADLGYVQ
jgi:predicted AlkP superfamily phosphohydrolase/phosphomutase